MSDPQTVTLCLVATIGLVRVRAERDVDRWRIRVTDAKGRHVEWDQLVGGEPAEVERRLDAALAAQEAKWPRLAGWLPAGVEVSQ